MQANTESMPPQRVGICALQHFEQIQEQTRLASTSGLTLMIKAVGAFCFVLLTHYDLLILGFLELWGFERRRCGATTDLG